MKLKRNQPIFTPPDHNLRPEYPRNIEVNQDFWEEVNTWHFNRTEEPKRKIMIDLFTPSKKNKPTP